MPRSHSRTMSNLRLQRRHYQFIADVINAQGGDVALANAFAAAMGGTNAHFDRMRFMRACGAYDEKPEPKPLCLLCQSEAKP